MCAVFALTSLCAAALAAQFEYWQMASNSMHTVVAKHLAIFALHEN
jgi:hypothetical protein